MWMRGGTSKGLFFEGRDVPSAIADRNAFLLRVMGSPDARQIDGVGGGHPLTSKVAIVSPSALEGVDVDYEFLQVGVEQAVVSGAQTCGNILAGVAPFAVERGLVQPQGDQTTVSIHLVNTGDIARATFMTPDQQVTYEGTFGLEGVPGTGNPIELEVSPREAPLFVTGKVSEAINAITVSLVNNGMPVAIVSARELGISGQETVEQLESMPELLGLIEELRIEAGVRMGLGDVTSLTVPKMLVVSPPSQGADVAVRALIPHRVHRSIGVLMAAGLAASARVEGSVAAVAAGGRIGSDDRAITIEHPSGVLAVDASAWKDERGEWRANSRSVRTARKLFDGVVYA
ncbi:MAG: PrpF domain-containing protein [Microbacteriaceae bacterium]